MATQYVVSKGDVKRVLLEHRKRDHLCQGGLRKDEGGGGGGAFLEERMRVCKCEFMFMTMVVCLGMVVYESECVPVYMSLLMCEFTHTQTVSVEEESLKTKESVLGSTHATTESGLPSMVAPFLLPPPNTGVSRDTSCFPL